MSHTLPRPTLTFGELMASVIPKGTGGRAKRSGAVHRTGRPIHRNSLEAGTFEHDFFVNPAPGETNRMLAAARAALDYGNRLKQKERKGQKLSRTERVIAALTAGSIRVYEAILMFARVCNGEIYPSYDRLAKETALSRDTVARALNLLEAAGFLIRQRRFVRLDDEAEGPRYQQTSNAYRPLLAQKLVSLLPRCMRPAPLPIDEVQREAVRQEDNQHMFAQLSCRELAQATLTGPLAVIMAKLGAAIDGQSASTNTVLHR